MKIHIVCRVLGTRILARQSADLVKYCNWTISNSPRDDVDYNYAFPYLELRSYNKPFVALFTHREDCVPDKVKIWEQQAARSIIRTTYCEKYKKNLEKFGPAYIVTPAIDRNKFVINPLGQHKKPVIGLSGFTYGGGRKGEVLINKLKNNPIFDEFEWRASGRGWPVDLISYPWESMQNFYQGLDLFLCPSLYEGVPYPPLEAMACGVRCIIPRDVGLLDELPDLPDLIRYKKGDLGSLVEALEAALRMDKDIDREGLRSATEKFDVMNWVNDHLKAFAMLEKNKKSYWIKNDKEMNNDCGIYVVAYGRNARNCAKRLINSAKKFMPKIPVALASDEPLGIENYYISCPDLDLGGRLAKIKIYELAPKNWKYILYLDADMEIVSDISFLFQAVRDGWDMVATKDTDVGGFHRIDKLFGRDANERTIGLNRLGTGKFTAIAGGVFCFSRNKRTQKFFQEWEAEWRVLGRRDQGALLRAMMPNPVKILLLCNHWNSFDRYFNVKNTAGLVHHQQQARRWKGNYPNRMDNFRALDEFDLPVIKIETKDFELVYLCISKKTFASGNKILRKGGEFKAKGRVIKRLVGYKLALPIKELVGEIMSDEIIILKGGN